MSQRVASLYAEIGADTTGLDRGLRHTKQELALTQQGFLGTGAAASRAFGQISTGLFLVGAGVKGLQVAYAGLRQGAALELTSLRFENLAEDIGTTADALRQDLHIATRGTISDAMLLETATQLMSLGLAKTHDNAVRLSRVAAALGMDIGEMVLALTNQTTRRFDQLGVSVDGFEERLKRLKGTGMDVNAAFTEAFLQQAEAQIERVGNVADTNYGKFLKFEASLQDVKNQLLGGALALGIWFVEQLDMNRAIVAGTEANKDYAGSLLDIIAATPPPGWHPPMAPGFEMPGARPNPFEGLDVSALNFDAPILSAEAFEAALGDLQLFVQGPLGSAFKDFGLEQQAMIEQAGILGAQIQILEGLPLTEAGQQELINLRGEMELVRQEIYNNIMAYDLQTKQMLFDLIVQRMAIAELPEAMRGAAIQMLNDIALAWGLIDQVTYEGIGKIDTAFALLAQGNLQEAKRELLTLGAWAEAIAGDYYVRFHLEVYYEEGVPEGMGIEPQGASEIEQAINNAVTDAISRGMQGFGDQFSSSLGSELETAKPTMRMLVAEFLDVAQVYSQIGSIMAQRLQSKLIDPLKQKIEGIDALLAPGHIDLVGREQAAMLEQQRAEAAQQVAEAEERILKLQEAQSNLAFLEQQIRLLDLIAQYNLDAASILQGLELGINADAGMVIEAMTRAIEEMIKAAQAKLEIGSPSKLTMEWGRFFVQGLALGVEQSMGMLSGIGNNLFKGLQPTSLPMGGHGWDMGSLVINVYPSEGMDEEALAQKVAYVFQTKVNV